MTNPEPAQQQSAQASDVPNLTIRRIVVLMAAFAALLAVAQILVGLIASWSRLEVPTVTEKGFVPLLSVIFALGSLALNRAHYVETTMRQEKDSSRQEEATKRQEVGVDQWMRDLRDWASEAVEVLSQAVYASEGMQDASSSDVRRYCSKLSALVDRGRFFLPNPDNTEAADNTEAVPNTKSPAFQGSRHRALVPLMAALEVLDGKDENHLKGFVNLHRRDVIRELQKEFVSHIQLILDPKGRYGYAE